MTTVVENESRDEVLAYVDDELTNAVGALMMEALDPLSGADRHALCRAISRIGNARAAVLSIRGGQ